MPLAPGQTLNNRYRILRLLGQGGFGTVYQAIDQAFGVPCAVKECLHNSVQAQEQFQREAVLLRTLRHTNLPHVLDYFILPTAPAPAPGGQTAYLVMDFIEGEDLDEMLEKNGAPLPEDQALIWIGQVCDALIYLHRQNPPIIHRDVKPTNIIITPSGEAILVDFGIAKQYQADKATLAAAQAFTPGFSPIEQYGGGGRTDARTDVYALGATLYTLLTGQPPTEATHRSPDQPLTPVRQLNPAVSGPVEAALMHALEIYPHHRFASVAEFKAALLAKEPVPADAAQWMVTRTAQPSPDSPADVPAAEKPPAGARHTLPGATGYLPPRPERNRGTPRRRAAPKAGWIALAGVAALGLIALIAGMVLTSQSQAAARQTAAAHTQIAINSLAGTSIAGTQAAQETLQAQGLAGGTATAASIAEQTQAAGTAAVLSTRNAEATSTAATLTAAPTATPTQDTTRAQVPAGEFWMGSEMGEDDEQPVHEVTVAAFEMDVYEIVNAQFADFLNVKGNQEQGGALWLNVDAGGGHLYEGDYWQADPGFADHPVVNVTWYGAQAYCQWAGGRLPTEAEWEKAARGRLKGAEFPWGDETPVCKLGAKRGAQNHDCDGGTVPVGSFSTNGYGLFDMAGNAAEWVADWYSADAYSRSVSSSPQGPDRGQVKVTRGGSWNNSPLNLSVSYRNWLAPYDVSSGLGFRCVYPR